MQSRRMSFLESLTQNVLGQLLSFAVLSLFGVEWHTAFGLMATMFFVSYVRSYCVRRFFTHLENRELFRGR